MKPAVKSIYIAKMDGAPMTAIESAELEVGRGIVGDRYHSGSGKFYKKLLGEGADDWQVTLVESEEIEEFLISTQASICEGDFRRNIVTSNLRLNRLVGHRFSIEGAVLEGIRLCEPCGYLSKLLKLQLVPVMNGRCGLRAKIIQGGKVSVGAKIELPGL